MSDKEIGLKVFRKFYDYNRTLNPSVFKLSFDQFLASYGKKADIYLDGIGGAVREGNVSDSRIESAMRSLAASSKGKILSNPLQMINAIQNTEATFNWIDAAAFVAFESSKDVLKGAVAIGDQVILTGKILTWLLPVIALIFVFYFVNKHTEGSLVNAARSFRK